MTTTESAWISPEARHRLQDEVEQLIRQRSTVGIDVAQSRSRGDLDNNDGSHRATAMLDSRIAQLLTLLSTATTTMVGDGVLHPGSTVTVMFDKDRLDTATFLLALSEEHETVILQVRSPRSPLGTALRLGYETTINETSVQATSYLVLSAKTPIRTAVAAAVGWCGTKAARSRA